MRPRYVILDPYRQRRFPQDWERWGYDWERWGYVLRSAAHSAPRSESQVAFRIKGYIHDYTGRLSESGDSFRVICHR